MNHPYLASANGHDRYNTMLKDADDFRRAKSYQKVQPKGQLFARLRQAFDTSRPIDTSRSVDTPA